VRKDCHVAQSHLSDVVSMYSNNAPSSSGQTNMTTKTDYEKFYSKWEKIIKSGMEEDFTQLNGMASWMLPKEDTGIKTVNRLQRELHNLTKLPKTNSYYNYEHNFRRHVRPKASDAR